MKVQVDLSDHEAAALLSHVRMSQRIVSDLNKENPEDRPLLKNLRIEMGALTKLSTALVDAGAGKWNGLE